MAPEMYRIVVQGRMSNTFADGFDDMRQFDEGSNTVLEGEVVDAAHLNGILEQIRGLGIQTTSFMTTAALADPLSIERLVRVYNESSTMTAVGLTQRPVIGEVAEKLEWLVVPTPRPGKHEVAIKVVASSLHIDEIYAAQGTALGRFYAPKYMSAERPHIMGSAVSGLVVGLGAEVQGFEVGDAVLVIPDKKPEAGSWATYRCVDHTMVMPKPASLSHEHAVATTMGACVACGAIQMSRVRVGDRCIVVGASGAIGTMVVGYLTSMGCVVTAVGSGTQSAARRRGAEELVDYRTDNFADHAERTNKLAAAVFDCVGGREVERNGLRSLGRSGVFVTLVGPRRYLGETRLSRSQALRVIGYVLLRMVSSRYRSKRYIFGERPPRAVIDEALQMAMVNRVYMPISAVINFDLEALKQATSDVLQHRSKGRVVVVMN